MGGSKLKWTVEEEQALRRGVTKYGKGKWRAIQKDEEFGPLLANRSNIDLKDKWRNLNIKMPSKKQSESSESREELQEEEDPRHAVIDHVLKAMGYTTSCDDDTSLTKRKRDQEAESTHSGIDRLAELVADQMLTAFDQPAEPCKLPEQEIEDEQKQLYKRPKPTLSFSQKKGPNVEDMVIAAVASLHGSNGSSVEEIYEWIELHYAVDPTFRRAVACTLRRLSKQGRLESLHYNDSCYRLAGIQHKASDCEEPVTVALDKVSRQAAEAAAAEAEAAAAMAAAQLRDQVFRSISACRAVVPTVCVQHQIAANGTYGGI